MVREIISINVGQCGLQLGQSVWEQYCAEHDIDANGKKNKNKNDDNTFLTFYEETDAGKYVARNLMVDLVPDIIDDVKNSKYSKVFQPKFLLAGKEDAGNCFTRGHYTVGKEMIDKVNDQVRRLVDACDNVQGFIMNHSVGGGTGSGLGCLILERLAVDYRKKIKIGNEVFSSPNHPDCCVSDPYNALLTTHWLLDHTEVSMVYDNEKLHEICQRDLKIETPSHHNVNRLISKNISSITALLRFEDDKQNFDLNEFLDTLVPFPRLHFLTPSMSPMIPKCDYFDLVCQCIDNSPLVQLLNGPRDVIEEIAEYTNPSVSHSVLQMIDTCFDPKSFFIKIDDFDAEEDKYMAINTFFRGDVKTKEANTSEQWMRTNKNVNFVDWVPKERHFTVRVLQENNYAILEDDDICSSERSLATVTNNCSIARFFSERVSKKYDLNYSQRAYIHWYVGEGMESGEFAEAREDLGFLEKDYLDVLSEQATDYDDEYSD